MRLVVSCTAVHPQAIFQLLPGLSWCRESIQKPEVTVYLATAIDGIHMHVLACTIPDDIFPLKRAATVCRTSKGCRLSEHEEQADRQMLRVDRHRSVLVTISLPTEPAYKDETGGPFGNLPVERVSVIAVLSHQPVDGSQVRILSERAELP